MTAGRPRFTQRLLPMTTIAQAPEPSTRTQKFAVIQVIFVAI